MDALLELNPSLGTVGSSLRPGQQLRIPPWDANCTELSETTQPSPTPSSPAGSPPTLPELEALPSESREQGRLCAPGQLPLRGAGLANQPCRSFKLATQLAAAGRLALQTSVAPPSRKLAFGSSPSTLPRRRRVCVRVRVQTAASGGCARATSSSPLPTTPPPPWTTLPRSTAWTKTGRSWRGRWVIKTTKNSLLQ